MSEIKWESPTPIPTPTQYRFTALRAALRENPQRWAVVNEYKTTANASNAASAFRHGDTWASYEVTSRGCTVYARYIGAEASS